MEKRINGESAMGAEASMKHAPPQEDENPKLCQ